MILAIEAICRDAQSSFRKAAERFDVPRSTLIFRVKDRVSRRVSDAKMTKLTSIEEEAIVRHVLDLTTWIPAYKGHGTQCGQQGAG